MTRSLRIITASLFLTLFSLLPVYAQGDDEQAPEPASSAVAAPERGATPVRITIPSLGLDTDVIPVGTDEYGAMADPDDPDMVAWYSLGPGLARFGNVVLAGHVDWDGQLRAFGRLQTISEGDEITLWNEAGQAYSFFVDSSDWVDADGATVDEIFGQSLESRVTLITCGGLYDPFQGQYLQRLIVRGHATTASSGPAMSN